MNDLIKELAKQATEYATTRHPLSNHIVLSVNSEKFEEKFAELIVRECAYLLENSTNDKRLDLSPELFRMLNNISKAQAEYICEHFGVEE
jgi:hypothetical protein